MKIFNSLGSNYDLNYVLQSLFADGHDQHRKLINFLEHKYNGKAILTYKGREALILALKGLNLPKDSCIAINGFTCYAVYKAVHEAGFMPTCLDLEDKNSDLNFSAETLRKALEQNKNIRVVVVQNTFGSPCDIEKIASICTEKNIIIIEDLAHCVGTKYSNGKEAGTVGDLVALSFSQDKIIDSVSGGALITRNKQISKLASQDQVLEPKRPKNQLKDRFYPPLTYKIRFFYNFGLGKLLHYIFKSLNLLSKPMTGGLYEIYSLPNWYCNLALFEFRKLNEQLSHRKEIARIYAKNLNKKILNSNIVRNISNSSNLRFSIFTENRGDLIKFLKKDGVFVSDIWYDSVAPECPNAVEFSKRILNLPTHINITKKSALKISEKVNEWLKIKII
jgi:perosamine synthetase